MKGSRILLLLAGASLLTTACAIPITSRSQFAPGWGPERRATFAWQDRRDRVVGDARLSGNEFFHQRLHEAVAWELSLRGMRYSEDEPDLLIHHHLSLTDHELESIVVDEMGVEYTDSYVYEDGSLVIHIVHARTGEDVWIGWGAGNVEPAFNSPEAMRSWVYELVGEIFDDWPHAPRQP